MNHIIYGIGNLGRFLYSYLGEDAVAGFADSYNSGELLYGKRVLSLEQLVENYKINPTYILISSKRYSSEIQENLLDNGIKLKHIWTVDDLPYRWENGKLLYISPNTTLKHYSINKYRRILLYGDNPFAELLYQKIKCASPDSKVTMVNEKNILNHINPNEMMEYDALIICVRRINDSMRETIECLELNIPIIDVYSGDRICPSYYCHPELEAYKNKHNGKRCFVIGNGPSLRVEDLDTLFYNREISIGCNKIYRIYDKTRWRANYIGFTDHRVIEDCKDDMLMIPGRVFCADSYNSGANSFIDGIQYFHMYYEKYYPNYPGFSNDFVSGFYNGMTVTYDFSLQFAAYIGCKEIYLLGVDHGFDGPVEKGNAHFSDRYFRGNELERYKGVYYEKERITRAYEKAEKYSRKMGFRIFNATRGGNLEVFERVSFDALF